MRACVNWGRDRNLPRKVTQPRGSYFDHLCRRGNGAMYVSRLLSRIKRNAASFAPRSRFSSDYDNAAGATAANSVTEPSGTSRNSFTFRTLDSSSKQNSDNSIYDIALTGNAKIVERPDKKVVGSSNIRKVIKTPHRSRSPISNRICNHELDDRLEVEVWGQQVMQAMIGGL